MYAIIKTGGKQYSVSPGDEILVEKLEGEVGSPVEFDRVVGLSPKEGPFRIAKDVQSAKVTGTISAHGRGKKIVVYKFKRRKMYRRKRGHRQHYTQVKIGKILLGRRSRSTKEQA